MTPFIQLEYKSPYDFASLLSFYRMRALQGIELIDEVSYSRTVRLKDENSKTHTGLLTVTEDAPSNCLLLSISESLMPYTSEISSRIERMFDIKRDPAVIAKGLSSLSKSVPNAQIQNLILPGCFEPFETICRAVLGQQVSVKAANNLAARIVQNYGIAITNGREGLTHAWPTPAEILAIPNLEEAFGVLGVIKNRSAAIREIAYKLENETTPATTDVAEQIEQLLSIKGIGPWTANYIAMRALSYTDAFLEKDVGVIHALPDTTPKERLALAEQWRPWRSYAVIAMWNSLAE